MTTHTTVDVTPQFLGLMETATEVSRLTMELATTMDRANAIVEELNAIQVQRAKDLESFAEQLKAAGVVASEDSVRFTIEEPSSDSEAAADPTAATRFPQLD